MPKAEQVKKSGVAGVQELQNETVPERVFCMLNSCNFSENAEVRRARFLLNFHARSPVGCSWLLDFLADLFNPDSDPVAPVPRECAITQNPLGGSTKIENSNLFVAQSVFEKWRDGALAFNKTDQTPRVSIFNAVAEDLFREAKHAAALDTRQMPIFVPTTNAFWNAIFRLCNFSSGHASVKCLLQIWMNSGRPIAVNGRENPSRAQNAWQSPRMLAQVPSNEVPAKPSRHRRRHSAIRVGRSAFFEWNIALASIDRLQARGNRPACPETARSRWRLLRVPSRVE
jgi:hypothetical protein